MAINYPTSLDDNESLYLAVNNVRTRLSAGIDDSVTTIPVLDTTGFPSTGFITILTGLDITEAEAISYTGLTATTFTGATRGADGTTARTHSGADNVDLTIVADHHNILKDAVIVLEQFVGVSGSENFVPKDQFGNVSISGTLTVELDTEFKADSTISGTLTLGEIPNPLQLVATCSNNTPVDFASTVSEQTVPGSCSTVLVTGTNLFLYQANFSIDANALSFLRVKYDDTDTAGEVFGGNIVGSTPDHWDHMELSGFKILESDGSQAAVLTHSKSSTSASVQVGAQTFTAVPLTALGLVEGTDYFFQNGSDIDDTHSVETDLTIESLVTNITLPGDYVVFGNCECHGGGATSGGDNIRYQLDSSDISPQYFFSAVAMNTFPFVKVINLTATSHTFEVVAQGGNTFSPSNNALFRRGRLFVIRADAFDQVVQSTKETTTSTASTSFTEISGVKVDYVPNVPEDILVLASPEFSNTVLDDKVTFQLVESGSGDVYSSNSGGRVGDTSDSGGSMLFAIKENVLSSSIWTVEQRSPQGNTVNTNSLNLIVLGLTPQPPTAFDIPFTTIDGNSVKSHKGTFDCVDVSHSLTISGIPVATGTGSDFNLTVRDQDSSPLVTDVTTIVVTSGTLIDDGGGQVTIQTGSAGGGSSLTVEEQDSDPSVSNVNTIKVTNGRLTDEGSGIVSIDLGAVGSASGNFSGALLVATTGIGVESGDVHEILWTSASEDTSGYFDSAQATRLTIPTGSGIQRVQIAAQAEWAIDSNEGMRFMRLKKNGSALNPAVTDKVANVVESTNTTVHSMLSYPISVSDGDYFEVTISQKNDPGGPPAVAVSTTASRTWVSIEDITPPPSASGVSYRGAMVKLTSDQTLSTSTHETISWEAEEYDTDDIFDLADPTVLTVPGGITRVRLGYGARMELGSTVGIRQFSIHKKGTTLFQGGLADRYNALTDAGQTNIFSGHTPVVTVTGGTQFEHEIFQDSTGDLDLLDTVNTWFSLEVIE